MRNGTSRIFKKARTTRNMRHKQKAIGKKKASAKTRTPSVALLYAIFMVSSVDQPAERIQAKASPRR